MKYEDLKKIKDSLPNEFEIENVYPGFVTCVYKIEKNVELEFIIDNQSDRICCHGYSLRGDNNAIFKYIMNNIYRKEK